LQQKFDNRLEWSGGGVTIRIAQKEEFSKIEMVVEESAQNFLRPIRWAYTLNNLTLNGLELIGQDTKPAGYLRVPRWYGSSFGMGDLPYVIDGTHFTINTPDLTGAVFPVTIDPSVAVAVGGDDWYSGPAQAYDFTASSNKLAVGHDNYWYSTGGAYRPGVRFLPAFTYGDTIDTATIDFISDGVEDAGTIYSDIYAIDEDDSDAPTSVAEWLADVALYTTAFVAWNFATVAAGTTKTTPDISAVLQEIADRPGRVADDAVSIHIDCDARNSAKMMYFASYENVTYDPPTLTYTFTPGAVHATATPSAIALTTVMPAPTPSAGSTATPSAIVPVLTMPAPATSVGVTVTASPIALTTVMPTPVASGGATAAPPPIALSVIVPTPAVTANQDAIATPAAIALTTVMPTPATSTGSTATPPVIALATVIPTPAFSSSATSTPAAIVLATVIPTPATSVGSTATPAAIALTTVMPAPAPGAGAGATPTVIALTVAVPTPTFTSAATATPAAIVPALTIPTPAASAGATATPTAIPLTVVIPTPGLSTGATATPAAIALTVVIPTPHVGELPTLAWDSHATRILAWDSHATQVLSWDSHATQVLSWEAHVLDANVETPRRTVMPGKIYVGAKGLAIRPHAVDESDDDIDLSAATTLEIDLKDPDGNVVTYTASAYDAGDGAGVEGHFQYVTASTAILDEHGWWEAQPYVVTPSEEFHLEPLRFEVGRNLQ
jgi:hypothetical protein